jgi:hypothetical protein
MQFGNSMLIDERRRASRWRRAVVRLACAAALVPLGALGGALAAQAVSPPVVQYVGAARGTFDLINDGLTPLSVVIEPFGFEVDSIGTINYVPLDTTKVKLRLSTMSGRVPPRSTYTIGYDVTADSFPRWLVVTATFSQPRRQGLNVRMQLPHVIYLNQRDALRHEDLVATDVVVDTAAKAVRVRVENRSARLGRVSEGAVRGAGRDEGQTGPFPVFPHGVRWVTTEWKGVAAPTRMDLTVGDRSASIPLPAPHP